MAVIDYFDGKCLRVSERIARKEYRSSGGFMISRGEPYWNVAFRLLGMRGSIVTRRYHRLDLLGQHEKVVILPTVGETYPVAVELYE